jgi:hypothetical protein
MVNLKSLVLALRFVRNDSSFSEDHSYLRTLLHLQPPANIQRNKTEKYSYQSNILVVSQRFYIRAKGRWLLYNNNPCNKGSYARGELLHR